MILTITGPFQPSPLSDVLFETTSTSGQLVRLSKILWVVGLFHGEECVVAGPISLMTTLTSHDDVVRWASTEDVMIVVAPGE